MPALGAEGDAVVAGGGQFEFEAQDHVAILFLGEQVAALASFADDVAIDDFVVLDGTLPVGEVFAVVEAGEALLALGEDFVGFFRADLADEDVAPPDLAAVGLELDGAFGIDGVVDPTGGWLIAEFAIGKEVFQHGVVDDDLAIEGDGDVLADHADRNRESRFW